uniref:Uncharacterized protein n=1 Tax=Globisporangium ultimum (strain ATCC 200006 / CBS 805.95 / DAOM BR144) TaxID=431595 RepID=K3WT35_GLOUD
MSEDLTVVEYIETVAPVDYALYIYYQDTNTFRPEKMASVVLIILIYAVLESLAHRTFGTALTVLFFLVPFSCVCRPSRPFP